MRNAGRVLVWVLSLSVIPAMLYADGYRNPPEGAAALGRGAARTVLTDDATTVSHNPANMVDLPDQEALAALTIIHTETEYSSPDGRSGTTDDPWKYIPSLFYTSPLKEGKMAVGVAVTSPNGQSSEWDRNGPFKYVAPYSASMTTIDVSPAFSAKLTDAVQVGIALDLIWSELSFEQDYPWSQVTGAPLPDGVAVFEGDGFAAGAHLGITWDMTEAQRLAFTYRSPYSVDYEGDFKISNLPPLPEPQASVITPSSSADTEITFPMILALGYGIDVNERFRLGAEVEWLEFSRYDQLDLNLGGNGALLPSTTLPQNWEDTFTYGIAGDYILNDQVTLRGGYLFVETPVPEETLAPSLPESDRHILTIGLGLQRAQHTIDLAYSYSIYADLEVSNNINPAFNGTYEPSTHLFAVSYAFDF